jgi:uncharacterized damage-inducible protein DinB
MMLIRTSQQVLTQLADLLAQLDDHQYTRHLDLLSDNTIGKHVRHVLEFWQCQVQGLGSGVVDYDARQRDLKLEENRQWVLQEIVRLQQYLDGLSMEQKIQLKVNYGDANAFVGTTISRELAYNIEHTVHHLAILKIAVRHYFPEIILPPYFGVAHSTLHYQQSLAVQ